ncbi:endo-1,4-beta-xylanase [Paenibacillus sp. NEAU-GSW1]|uniref:endo-1,4-beta-xylanase n=1 Tax=Paenibacillus sp. NEAU-GSW1 TaxID=2682486 RepID=UPI0012E1F5BF|nr:endo-1,4-beta-xylanase [Paenibacillus sp. NEAU-GSW1]MUT68568.1 1,4-beta-xylanase [Paenibacillus sp. NEAU-GSW1]
MKKKGLKRSLSGVLAIALMLASLSLSVLPKQAEAEASSMKIATDFEDGTVQGWQGRGGNEVLSALGAAAHTGSYGLQVTGRTQSWNGMQLDVTSIMTEGKTYALTAWVKLPAGTAASSVSMTVQRTTDGKTDYEGVTSGNVTADGWAKFSGQYQLKQPIQSLFVYFEASSNPTLDFYIDDFSIEQLPEPGPIVIQQDIPSLKDEFADDFMLGTALLVNEIEDPNGPDAQLIKKHFNSLTAGNELKWDATEPQEGQFNFTRSDKIVNFAVENGIAMRGHTLIWHSQTPEWVFYDENGNLASKELLFARMKRHIENVVGRYKGKIYAWDVVNEVLEPGDKQPGGLRNSLWYKIAGEEFIEKAFQYAHEADPNAKLFINDYNTNMPDKRQDLHDLIKRLKDKGIPVDGVGHQTHIGIESPQAQELDDMIQAFTDLNIEQQVTELDMSVYTNDNDAYETFSLELQVKQARRYKEIFDVFRKHADQLTAVIFWGKDDLNTWLRTFPVDRNNWPLLFDERLQAKYAYWALVDPSKLPVDIQNTTAANVKATIDGKLGDGWSKSAAVSILNEGAPVAKFKTLWAADHLYITVDVSDTSTNGNDAVEVFIDGNNGKTTQYEADDKKYTFSRSGENSGKPAEYKAVKLADGYRIEAAIPVDGLSLNKKLGLDVRIVNKEGSTVTKTSWNDRTASQDFDTSQYGVLTLIEGPQDTKAQMGTPVIDGNIDALWSKANLITTDRWVQGTNGAKAKVRTLWDEGRLYVLAEVTDSLLSKLSPNVWEQDSVEIFVDQNKAATASYQADDGQYRINFDNEQSVNPGSLSENLVSAVKRTANGYLVEASIKWNGTSPAAGDIIGFDVQVNNDEDGDGDRDSVAIWNDRSGQSFTNTSGFGLLKLLGTK